MKRTWLILLGAALALSCEGDRGPMRPIVNDPPGVAITGGAADSASSPARIRFEWRGWDDDGVVNHFLYAIDEGQLVGRGSGEELTWTRIDAFSGTFQFPADEPIGNGETASAWHRFSIKAVDDDGAESAPDERYFNAVTIAPTVTITSHVGEGEEGAVWLSCREGVIEFKGHDFDGSTSRPAGYQFKLVGGFDLWSSDEVIIRYLTSPFIGRRNLLIPDSLLANGTYAPLDWWPRDPTIYADRPFTFPTSLVSTSCCSSIWALAVRAVDEAGAVSPSLVVSRGGLPGNVLKVAAFDSDLWITITVEEFLFGQQSELYFDPGMTLPAGLATTFSWHLNAPDCPEYESEFSYAVDMPDTSCTTCTDPKGMGAWSPWSDSGQSVAPIAFEEPGQHRIDFRARLIETGAIHARGTLFVDVYDAPLDRPALWVDDFAAPMPLGDCEHDAFVEELLENALVGHTPSGAGFDVFEARAVDGDSCTESGALQLPPEEFLYRYRLLLWNRNGSASALGLVTDPDADTGHVLRQYVYAGGRLLVWGEGTFGGLLGDFFPPTSYRPRIPLFGASNFGPGSFPWDVLLARTEFDRVRGVSPRLQLRCSGLIGLQATSTALAAGLPAGVLDPTGYSTNPSNTIVSPKTALWADVFAGAENLAGRQLDCMTGIPPLHVQGLDTLYVAIPNAWTYEESESVIESCGTMFGSPFKEEPIVVRYRHPSGGRVVWMGTPLHPFRERHAEELRTLMSGLVDWLLEEP